MSQSSPAFVETADLTQNDRRRPGRFEVDATLLPLLRDPIDGAIATAPSNTPYLEPFGQVDPAGSAELDTMFVRARAGDTIQAWKLNHLVCPTREILQMLVKLDRRGVNIELWPL